MLKVVDHTPLISAVLHEMPEGKERRRLIKQYFEDGKEIAVNNKHQRQVKKDKDLKKLLKSGFVKMDRLPTHSGNKSAPCAQGIPGRKSRGKSQSILVKNG